MMKKTYILPAMRGMAVNAKHQLLAASDRTLGLGASGSANAAESRSHDTLWDEDDD